MERGGDMAAAGAKVGPGKRGGAERTWPDTGVPFEELRIWAERGDEPDSGPPTSGWKEFRRASMLGQ